MINKWNRIKWHIFRRSKYNSYLKTLSNVFFDNIKQTYIDNSPITLDIVKWIEIANYPNQVVLISHR